VSSFTSNPVPSPKSCLPVAHFYPSQIPRAATAPKSTPISTAHRGHLQRPGPALVNELPFPDKHQRHRLAVTAASPRMAPHSREKAIHRSWNPCTRSRPPTPFY